MKKIRVLLIVFALLSALTIFAGSSSQAQEYKEIPFGYSAPLSGPAAPWGILGQRALEVTIDRFNQAGGLKVAGQKYKWKLVVGDNGYVPSKAVSVVMGMSQDGIKFMATMGGACAVAVAPITEKAGMLTLNMAMGGAALTKPEHPLTFRYNWDTPPMYAGFYLWLKKNHPNVKTVALINPDDETGWDAAKHSKKNAEIAGIKVVAEEFYPRSLTDFYPMASKILAKKPDLLDYGISPGGSSALLTLQTGELGYKGMRLIYAPNVALQTSKAGNYNEGAYFLGVVSEPRTEAQKIAHGEFMKRYPAGEWDSVYYEYWEMISVLSKAIEKANTLDTKEIAKALHGMEFDTIYGAKARFNGKLTYGTETVAALPIPLSIWKDGKIVYIDTIVAPPEW